MNDKIYYLSSCSTCVRILKELPSTEGMELIDIKVKSIDAETLDWLKSKVGSYEALFSKRAQKFKLLPNKGTDLKEEDYRNLILEEYTFLKRPYIIKNNEVMIGNAKKEIERAISLCVEK
jgi:arsenate reductase (glutaredoxin)